MPVAGKEASFVISVYPAGVCIFYQYKAGIFLYFVSAQRVIVLFIRPF